MQISLELSEQIKQRLMDFVDESAPDDLNLRRIASDLNALPLCLDMGGVYAIRPDGQIISFCWDKEKDYQVENDRRYLQHRAVRWKQEVPRIKTTDSTEKPRRCGMSPIAMEQGLLRSTLNWASTILCVIVAAWDGFPKNAHRNTSGPTSENEEDLAATPEFVNRR